jgi:hypothetical protein
MIQDAVRGKGFQRKVRHRAEREVEHWSGEIDSFENLSPRD